VVIVRTMVAATSHTTGLRVRPAIAHPFRTCGARIVQPNLHTSVTIVTSLRNGSQRVLLGRT